jgi:hypothetical protein
MVKSIRDQFIIKDDEPGDVEIEVKKKNKNYTENPDIMMYHHHSHELFYQIRSYSDRKIFNKRFYRENFETNKGSNWKLNLLGPERRYDEDLVDTLNPNVAALRNAATRTETTYTRLNNIIDLLYGRGVRKLIIIDLSCSVIRKGKFGLTERGDRNLAYEAARIVTPPDTQPQRVAEAVAAAEEAVPVEKLKTIRSRSSKKSAKRSKSGGRRHNKTTRRR